MKLQWCDRDLMLTSCYFTLCTTEALFKKAMKHLKVKPEEVPPFVSNWHSNATTHYFENQTDKSVSAVICIRDYEKHSGIEVACLLVHEACHIWQRTCKDYGEYEPSTEFEAYAIQNISQQLMYQFREQTK